MSIGKIGIKIILDINFLPCIISLCLIKKGKWSKWEENFQVVIIKKSCWYGVKSIKELKETLVRTKEITFKWFDKNREKNKIKTKIKPTTVYRTINLVYSGIFLNP